MALASSLCIAAPERSGSLACFGRFLMDVPPGASVSRISTDYLFGSLKSERVDIDEKGFAQFVAKREDAYKGSDKKNNRILVRSYAPYSGARIIVAVEDVFGHDNFGFEAYGLKGPILFSMNEKSYEEKVLKEKVLPSLEKMLSNLRSRQFQEAPVSPGLCI